jgi:phospholipid/cholesterol/gamma-HCH transport system permease protein
MNLFRELGSIFLFSQEVVSTFFKTRGNVRPVVAQMAHVSYRSLGTVIFAGIFVGAILALQFHKMLSQYDATVLLGGLNTSALMREVGPLIISFLLAGKIGAYTAAELGGMRVTEQIDAIQCLGANPIQYLVVPRYFAIILSSLILLCMGVIVGVTGSAVLCAAVFSIHPLQYISSIPRFIDGWTVFNGMFKCLVYAAIVAAVCCHKGYTASGGARGVGRAVTQASIFTNFYIVLANYFTSLFLEFFYSLVRES